MTAAVTVAKFSQKKRLPRTMMVLFDCVGYSRTQHYPSTKDAGLSQNRHRLGISKYRKMFDRRCLACARGAG